MVPPKAQRRQLTQQQQTHILSDIQKHQHRFNLHQNQRSPNVFIQPSIQIPVPPQPHSRQPFSGPSSTQQHFQPNAHFHHHSNNLHPPPPPSSPANGPVNSFRAPSGRPGPSFGAQQDTRLPPQQRSVQNQLQQATFFNGPPPPPHTNGPAPVSQPLNSQPSSFLNSIDTPTFGAPQRPNSLQAPFLQTPPSFTGNGQVRFPSQGAPSNGANLGQQPVPLFTNQQLPLHNSPQNFKLSGPNAGQSTGQLSVIPLKPNSKKDYSSITQSDLDVLLSANRQTLFQTIKSETAKPAKAKPTKVKSTKALGRDDLLKQLKLALAETSPDLGGKNYSSTDLVLPNGEKVQVIRTTDPEIIKRANANSEGVLTQQLDSPTTPKPLSFEDIARSGLLPPGADFELIKQTEDGQIQEVGKIPPQKKVTFVYLEEQDDGSYKVQGVKGSGDKETKTSGADVDSILKRIKNGEIQLPPPSSVVSKGSVAKPDLIEDAPITTTTPRHQPIKKANSVTIIPHSTPIEDHASTAFLSGSTVHHTASPAPATIYASTPSPASPSSGVTAYSPGGYSGSTLPQQVSARLSTPSPVSGSYTADSTARFSEANSVYTPVSTTAIPPATPAPSIYQTANTEKYFSDTATAAAIEQQQQTASTYQHQTIHASHQSTASDAVPTASASETITQQQQDNTLSAPKEDTQQQQNELPAILKNNGLFAMAKYLRQSGLDTILNETGPYTIFVPTDKAFRSLLVQLGGPEKAEEKFRNNPRLLSGLLLHHVIPGSFEIASLQDEMTGVSLAGTQLRVNQYNMHDSEWNDVKVTTINGAMVVPDKQDIVIPQGIAHAVDRVMFPLPVGDILQTLQSDRERRFTHFLRALFASGMSDTLQNKGIKTYTVFAPTDAAFAHLSTEELTNLVTEKDQAEELVRKHVVPGTLFTAGMRFYQVKDVMAEGKTVTLQKTGGKIKVNDGYLQTSNIPTTNGVIHAIDSLL
uniref:FAS1 domain-containing protein n=1 Tax=Anopheles coluzzii TaxID=1518534 RepID=A0A8W7P079_ANOCL